MLDRLHRIFLPALVIVGLFLAAPARGAAQVPPPTPSAVPLLGVVVDESFRPVDSATVTLLGTDTEVTTGRLGIFAFPNVPPGSVVIRVSAPGHPSVVQEVEVTVDRVAFFQIELLSVAAVLSELGVTSAPSVRASDVYSTAADLLALLVPRAHVSGGLIGTDSRISLRSGTTVHGNTQPLVVIDGVVMTGGNAFEALEQIPAEDVRDISRCCRVRTRPSFIPTRPMASST